MSEYKYTKICELARCSKTFKTNRENQKFCKYAHRIEYHQTQKKEASDMLRRIELLEKEIKDLRDKYDIVGIEIKTGSRNSLSGAPGLKEVNDTDKEKKRSSL